MTISLFHIIPIPDDRLVEKKKIEGIVSAFLRKLLALHDSGQSAEKKNEARNRGRELG
jgi:hypothetical protein